MLCSAQKQLLLDFKRLDWCNVFINWLMFVFFPNIMLGSLCYFQFLYILYYYILFLFCYYNISEQCKQLFWRKNNKMKESDIA